tara:strand:- start:43 stop:330 length:288 start_codon:yes stop_codon:yes gene_type:complete
MNTFEEKKIEPICKSKYYWEMYCIEPKKLSGCGLKLGKIEENNSDILDGLCLECFREMIDQTHVWYDKKSYEQSMKILKHAKFPFFNTLKEHKFQ